MTPADLRPGDALLYRPMSVFGVAIAMKSGHSLSHVEIYVGGGHSVASRDGLGTGYYPLRTSGLALVSRPLASIDVRGGLAWYHRQPYRPYGWRDLAAFFDLPVPAWWSEGIVCSPFAAAFWMDGCRFPAFNARVDRARIFPFEFAEIPTVDVLRYAA